MFVVDVRSKLSCNLKDLGLEYTHYTVSKPKCFRNYCKHMADIKLNFVVFLTLEIISINEAYYRP